MSDGDSPGRFGNARENRNESRNGSLIDWFRSLFARSPNLREDIAEALQTHPVTTDGFSQNERAILQNVLNLGDMRVDDVMVPRADIEAVETSDSMSTLMARFHLAGHSRLPVFEDSLDHIVGFVHIKDALQRLTQVVQPEGNGNTNSRPAVKFRTPTLRQKVANDDMVRQVLFVPPSKPVGDLLQSMQATRVHMAIVVDEYGGTDGLVTIEDLLEAVVGDIEDEHDEDEVDLLKRIDDNHFIAEARIALEELEAALGPDFNPVAYAEEADTLGGLLFDLVDRVPVRGEVISKMRGFEFEILAADPRRIRKVKITRRKRAERARAVKTPVGTGKPDAGQTG